MECWWDAPVRHTQLLAIISRCRLVRSLRKSFYPRGSCREDFCSLLLFRRGAASRCLGVEPFGEFVELHSCDLYTGGCTASSESTLLGRQLFRVWSISQGTWDNQDLAGLKVALLELGSVNLARKRGVCGEGGDFRAKRFGGGAEGGAALLGDLPGDVRPPQHGWWKPISLISALDAPRHSWRLVIPFAFHHGNRQVQLGRLRSGPLVRTPGETFLFRGCCIPGFENPGLVL